MSLLLVKFIKQIFAFIFLCDILNPWQHSGNSSSESQLLPKVGLPVSQLLAGTIVVISAILIIAGRKKAAALQK